MKYINPDIESSYQENDLGQTLYNIVLERKPKKIVEIGVLHGYSTVAMAMALDELGEGRIIAYDLFEDYKFKHGTMGAVQAQLERYGIAKYVTLVKKDFDEWLAAPEQFDLLHLDISNKGDTIERLYVAVKDQVESGASVLFEGGSAERDEVEWMEKFHARSIRSAQGVPFQVIDSRFPSLSEVRKMS